MIYKFQYTCMYIILFVFLDIHADTKSSTLNQTDAEKKNTDMIHNEIPPKPIAAIKYQQKSTDSSNSSTKKEESSNNSSTSSTTNSSSDKKEESSSDKKDDDKETIKAPEQKTKPQNIITSVYIQNNFGQNCILKKIEILLANQAQPFVKDNLNIQIAAAKKIYTRGTITAFDITTTDSVQSFNGIKSIIIDTDTINFDNPNIGSSKLQPILITKKNGRWILDK
ncbi:MAG: hypothetical protein ACXWL5_03700 [Candidatus Chromulinivorax sp.]